MKKQIFNKSLPFANLLILTLVSNVNAGNYLFHTVIDASALAVGNALTGARFSHDAGLTNPARINQFKPGTFLCSSESRFSGTLNRQIFAYRSLSFPFKFLFLHEGTHNIPDTRFALIGDDGNEMLNGNERLITDQISYFNQHRFGVIIQHLISWEDWYIGMGYNTVIYSLAGQNGYGITINCGIFKQVNSSFSVGLEIKNIEILPMKWTTGYQESWSQEIFIGGSITPVMQNMWCKINLFLDGGLRFKERTLDDDFHVDDNGGIIRYGIELNADEKFALRIGRSGKGKLAFGFSVSTEKNILNYTLSTKQGWGENSTGHIFTFLLDVETIINWFK